MIKHFDFSELDKLKSMLKQRKTSNLQIEQEVRDILKQVRENGDLYLEEITRKFDCPNFSISNIKVKIEDIKRSTSLVPDQEIEILREVIENVRNFHNHQKDKSWIQPQDESLILGQLVNPVERVGLYVPGGKGGTTPLISTLIMNAVPAQIAGVGKIVVVTPPSKSGDINPYLLATANLLGIYDIYKIGSAWAIGALAYGTKSVPKVDMIVGPGNIYVTIAKKLLIGEIGIDMIAGPSEIVVIADEHANPSWIAADLLSQAEHDYMACSIFITPSKGLIDKVEKEIKDQLVSLGRKDIAEKSLKEWGAFIHTKDIEQAIDAANELAPEHLEIHVMEPWNFISRIKNAGCVFLGEFCPEPVGDYFAGPNHVLPTTSTARFSSGLSVETFYKKTNLIWATKDYVNKNAHKIARLARLEGLEAHARSAEIRIRQNK